MTIQDPPINELHYYNIHEDGTVTKKNFFGRAIAWILNKFGMRTAYDVFVRILPLLQTPRGPLLSLRGRVSFQHDELKKIGIANTIFHKRPTMTLTQAIKESIECFGEGSWQILEKQLSTDDFLQLMQQDEQKLLEQFQKDTEKQDHWEIGSRSIPANRIEAELKAKLEAQYPPNIAAQKLEEIKLYANQKLGTILCAGQANCERAIRSKCIPAKIESLQLMNQIPITVRAAEKDVTYHFSEDLRKLTYEITWDVKLRNQTSQATFKSRVTIDLATHALSFEPFFDRKIAEDCTVEDRQILTRIFTTPASPEYYKEIDRLRLSKLKRLNAGEHILIENDPDGERYLQVVHGERNALNALFTLDAHRGYWQFGDEKLNLGSDVKTVEEKIREHLKINIRAEQPDLSDSEVQSEVERRLKHIKLYANQRGGTSILSGGPNLPDEFNAKSPLVKFGLKQRLFPETALSYSKPTYRFTADMSTLFVEGEWQLQVGDSKRPRYVTMKGQLQINLKSGQVTVKPLYDVRVASDCPSEDLAIAAGIFL